MKFIMILTIIFQILLPAEQAVSDFDTQVNSGYEVYSIVYEDKNTFYDLKIVQGINNGNMNFGIVLYNVEAKTHSIQVISNGKKYLLPANDRGDYLAPAVKYTNDIEIQIINEQSINKKISLEYFTPETYSSDNLVTGNNEGIKTLRMSSSIGVSKMGIISLIFAGVIVICGLVIYAFYRRRKGIFSEQKRKENVFDFHEFYGQYAANQNDDLVLNKEGIVIPETDIDEETVPAYERQRDYDDEDVEIDVEAILQSKGYNTDYANALEIEKNDVMLELMRMRDDKEITQEQYRKETIKLWKK